MKKVIEAIKHFFKVRLYAKRVDVWGGYDFRNISKYSTMIYWISYDNNIYCGNPWGYFFLSAFNLHTEDIET